MNDWLAEQSRRNRQSCGQWTAFAGHRQRVTALLVEAALDRDPAQERDRPSLCLLGAGNCNDLDLATLLRSYGQIHLVDCDAAALASGIERQAQTGQPALVAHGGVDLLGLPQTRCPVAPAELIASVALHRPLHDLAAFDVAASLCLLSQLTEAGAALLTGDESHQLQLVQAIRRRHLELLVELLKPGGRGLLITDLVSSETAPRLQTVPEVQLAAFVADCISRRNFFTGLNPAVLLDLLRHDSWFTSQIEDPTPIHPWKWDFGPRSYVVYAIRFRRRIES